MVAMNSVPECDERVRGRSVTFVIDGTCDDPEVYVTEVL